MSKIEIKSEHTPKVWKKLWQRRVVELTSKNKAAYFGKQCYFGTIKDDELMVYFHKDNDGGHMTTRFMGKIEKDGKGSRITGRIGKMDSALAFLVFAIIFLMIGAVAMLTQQMYQQGLLLVGLAVICLGLILITPKESAARLERLLNQISVDPVDLLEDDNK